MNLNQTRSDILALDGHVSSGPRFRSRWWLRAGVVVRVALILLVLLLAGSSGISAEDTRSRSYSVALAGHGFDLLGWELRAIRDKAGAAITRPSTGLESADASMLVIAYMDRADRLGQLEREISVLLSESSSQDDDRVVALQSEVDALRAAQVASRLQVEQIIERQVSYALDQAGFVALGYPFPPVQFTFTEPPKKLIVSPRDRISMEFSRMLTPDISIADIESAEADIDDERVRSYITNVGGLGAFPTMVVDRASLSWVLSTVAHEWTHNYLTLHPLGWSYFKNQDMTTLNESVAEIVGNEIGAEVERWFYGVDDTGSGEPMLDATGEALESPRVPHWEKVMESHARFDFREEMRETRLTVDLLLEEGRIEDAENYMEERRQEFVDNGYPLRVLNQAYFAFHGSYGTSAASTSPIGPKLDELRELTPNLKSFLTTVQSFTDIDDLDAALDEWAPRTGEST